MDIHQKLDALYFANLSRVLTGGGSPKILIGGLNLTHLNFHTFPMIEMGASLVTISIDPEDRGRPDRLFCNPFRPIHEALETLPAGWSPDFFFDSQVEHGHYIPPGLGELEIPLIASFNHAHLGQALMHSEGLFDCLIKPSESHAYGDAYLPFGASWGTMGGRLQTLQCLKDHEGSRPIDVSCTIGTTKIGKQSVRFLVLDALRNIQKRRKDWKIEIASGLTQEGYFDLLSQSKASINVGAWGTTMTYRPLEVIAQGSALIHVDETAYGSKSSLADFFQPHWYTSATPDTLEEAIAQALTKTRDELVTINQELEAEYAYTRQYERLFALAKTVKKGERVNGREYSRRVAALSWVNGFKQEMFPHLWSLIPEDLESIRGHNELDWTGVSFWQPEDPELRYRWQTDLAKKEKPALEIYNEYAELGRKSL